MGEIVYLRRNDAFTDSMVIANATNNQHKSVVKLIKQHMDYLEKFGRVEFSDLKSLNPKGGRPTKIYHLNEMQATLLVTFLDNTKEVVDFKVELVKQFYEMRKFIAEKNTKEWIETRQQGKLTRKAETDVIQELVEYARVQGSTHSQMLYVAYSKLANAMAGVGKRDQASVTQLNNLSIFENIILTIIRNGMKEGLNYKEIYQVCKSRCEQAKEIAMIS